MKCPKCYKHVDSFWRWAIWPGPTRHCRNCGVKLRYVGFYPQAAAHGVVGVLFFIFGKVIHTPSLILWLVLAVVLSFTAFFLPWRFGRYKEIADQIGLQALSAILRNVESEYCAEQLTKSSGPEGEELQDCVTSEAGLELVAKQHHNPAATPICIPPVEKRSRAESGIAMPKSREFARLRRKPGSLPAIAKTCEAIAKQTDAGVGNV